MGRSTAKERLTDARVRSAKPDPAKAVTRLADGGGLYLSISKGGGKSWVFRFTLEGKTSEHGLGAYPSIPLKSARELARKKRDALEAGIAPQSKSEQRRKEAAAKRGAMTFEQVATAYLEAHSPAWSNEKHRAQWKNTLKEYAYPHFGSTPVEEITAAMVATALRPIWLDKVETAARVRMRIARVLDYAKASGYRKGDNPAEWRGSLEALLPKQPTDVKHHEALPYKRLPAFVQTLRATEGIGPFALEFVILTAARVNEALKAKWSEVDLDHEDGPVWTVPAERMKAGRAHRVPLPPRAAEILKKVQPLRDKGGYIFPSPVNAKEPLTDATLLKLSKEASGSPGLTTHGFRSAFRDWASEETSFPNMVAELALAHAIEDRTEAAYRRGDLFDKRRLLMAAWATYCDAPAAKGNVVPMKKAG